METNSNIYDANRINIDLFFGRNEICQSIVRGLAGQRSYAMMGGRRMGKTTMLRRIESELQELTRQQMELGIAVIPIYIDVQSLMGFDQQLTMQSLSDGIVSITETAIEKSIGRVAARTAGTLDSRLKYLMSYWEDIELRLVFLFDETELIVQAGLTKNFGSYWRYLLKNCPGVSEYICIVLSGNSEVEELARDQGSPIWNVLEKVIDLELFKYADTCLLATVPCGRTWDEEFLQVLHRLTGGHPHLIQYVMAAVCETGGNSPLLQLRTARRSLERQLNSRFGKWAETFTAPMRDMYSYIAQSNSAAYQSLLDRFGYSQVEKGLRCLVYTGVIARSECAETGESFYQVGGELFKEYFFLLQGGSGTDMLDARLARLLKENQIRALYKECYAVFAGYDPDNIPEKVPDWLTALRYMLQAYASEENYPQVIAKFDEFIVISRNDQQCLQIRDLATKALEELKKDQHIQSISLAIMKSEEGLRKIIKWLFKGDEAALKAFVEGRPQSSEWFLKWENQKCTDERDGKLKNHAIPLWIIDFSPLWQARDVLHWKKEDMLSIAGGKRQAEIERCLIVINDCLQKEEAIDVRNEAFHTHLSNYSEDHLSKMNADCGRMRDCVQKLINLLGVADIAPESYRTAIVHGQPEVGQLVGKKVRCTVTHIIPDRVFVRIEGVSNRCSISIRHINGKFIRNIHEYVNINQELEAFVFDYNEKFGYQLSLYPLQQNAI